MYVKCSNSAKAEKGVEMNNIQNFGMTNYQVNFQARSNRKAITTLADKVKQIKYKQTTEINKIISDFADKYCVSPKETREIFNIDKNTTKNQLINKISDFKRTLEELKQAMQ